MTNAQLKEKIKELKTQIDQHNEKIKTQDLDIEQLIKELRDKDDEIAKNNRKTKSLEKKLDGKEQEVKNLNGLVEYRDTEIKKMQDLGNVGMIPDMAVQPSKLIDKVISTILDLPPQERKKLPVVMRTNHFGIMASSIFNYGVYFGQMPMRRK